MDLCFYHNDADGRSSAAIVHRALGKDIILTETNYGEPVPWELVERAKHVIVVDFSMALEDMQRMAENRLLTWIDHHISAIQDLREAAAAWQGLQATTDAACVLTWKYFFPDQPIPRAVVLIGDRDTWTNAHPDSAPFNEGLRQQNTSPDNDKFWKPLLDDDPKEVQELIDYGNILRDAHLREIRRSVKRFGQEVNFEGHSTLAINLRAEGEIGEHIRKLGYEIAYCYIEAIQNGKLTTFVTLFSDKVDVSEIAKKYGGGGHKGAAGFSFERGNGPFPNGAVKYPTD